MKKVKIMLMSVLVLAVVAGAFAFKAKKSLICVYSTTDAINATSAICTLTTDATFAGPGETQFTTTAYYQSVTVPCTTTLTQVPCKVNGANTALLTTILKTQDVE